MMPEITVDVRELLIIENVKQTLRDITIPYFGAFTDVITFDDVESFIRVVDPLKASPKTDAGIIVGESQDGNGSDDTELAVRALPFSVVIRFCQRRVPGEDESAAMSRSHAFGDVVRSAILADPSRGGNANLVVMRGNLINGTQADGDTRLVSRAPNNMFYASIVPFITAYSIFAYAQG